MSWPEAAILIVGTISGAALLAWFLWLEYRD